MTRFLEYICRNCGKTQIDIAVGIRRSSTADTADAYKHGEYPPFGPPTPARVLALIAPDKDLFLKGRRAEFQGLGIAAFAYYRRVIENQWGRLIERVVALGDAAGITEDEKAALVRARARTKFSEGLEVLGDRFPPSLLIRGQSPLRLLHTALSEGLHDRSDEECLALATAIRSLLATLGGRMSELLAEDAEVNQALTVIHQRDTPARPAAPS